jgi:hypothetical protein
MVGVIISRGPGDRGLGYNLRSIPKSQNGEGNQAAQQQRPDRLMANRQRLNLQSQLERGNTQQNL